MGALQESEILRKGVQLCATFSESPECTNEPKFATGVCTDCSRYYSLENDGSIQPKQKCPTSVNTSSDGPVPESDEVEDGNNQWNINPYSAQNLMSTCIWPNAEQYRDFIKTLTYAEKWF